MGALQRALEGVRSLAAAKRQVAEEVCRQAERERARRKPNAPNFGRKIETPICDRLFQRLDIEIRKLTEFQSRSNPRQTTLASIKKKQDAITKQLVKYNCFRGGSGGVGGQFGAGARPTGGGSTNLGGG